MPTETACLKCGGTGWVIRESANLSGAEACDCRMLGREARLKERAQIPPLYQDASFSSFKIPTDNPNALRDLTSARLAVLNYVRDFPNHARPGLLLMGDPGTGKTHLAVSALRVIIEKGFEGIFWDYQNLLDRIRAGYDPTSNSSDKMAYRLALDAEVLVLDDLGANRVLDWIEDTICSIITHRCNNRKPFIATTNLSDGDVGNVVGTKLPSGETRFAVTLAERIGARARSRLFEMCTVVHMPNVADYRVKTGQKWGGNGKWPLL